MSRKTLGVSLMVIGVVCLLSALGLKCYDNYVEWQIALEIERGVRDSVFLVDHEAQSGDSVISDSTEELEDIISSVDQDQEIAEVVTYKNVLDIPKIECQAYIGSDTGSWSLHRGVGHHPETVAVGEVGNCVIAGHASRTYKTIRFQVPSGRRSSPPIHSLLHCTT